MKIDLIGGNYEHKYQDLNSQVTVNWYPVMSTDAEGNKSPTSLFPTPGLTLHASPTLFYHRGAFVARAINKTRTFFVGDTALFELKKDGSTVTLGNVINLKKSKQKIWMAVNGNSELFICNNHAGYVFNMNTDVLTQVTSDGFLGLDTLAYMDGYFIGNKNGRVYYSELNNGLSWVATDVLTPTFKADPVKAVSVLRNDLYAFGSETIEVYVNDGSPFVRLPRSSASIGILASESLVSFPDGHFFLGRTADGEAKVYFMDVQYNINVISPFSISWQINKKGDSLKDSYGYLQETKDGHTFYYLTIPILNKTYVYDVVQKQWHVRQSTKPIPDADGAFNLGRFRGRHYVNNDGQHLFFDCYSGNIFIEDFTNATENNTRILRIRKAKTYSQDQQNISVTNLEIEANIGEAATLANQGSDPILMIEISRDGGKTYGQPRNIKLGAYGAYIYRARINKLGTSRNWTVQLTLSDPIDLMIQNAIARGTIGTS